MTVPMTRRWYALAAEVRKQFNPQRLRIAREQRGLTKEALATLCGVSRRAVTGWETGQVEEPQIDRLAQALEFPAEFFCGEDLVDVSDDEVSFRAYTSISMRRVRSALATASMLRVLSDWIDHSFDTPELDLPLMADLLPAETDIEPDPVQCAYSLRRYWAIAARPIPNMTALLESHGVRIFSLPRAMDDVDAFSYWSDGRPTVFLNLEKSAERVRFDLAHELGHIVMHRGVRTRSDRHFEISANIFASSLLMPSDGLLPQVRFRPQYDDMLKLKRFWRVSATSMTRRLHQLGLINDWQYRRWMVDLSAKGYRSSEPDGIKMETSALLQGIINLARSDGMTLRRLSFELSLPLSNLEEAISGLAMIPLSGGADDSPGTSETGRRLRVV